MHYNHSCELELGGKFYKVKLCRPFLLAMCLIICYSYHYLDCIYLMVFEQSMDASLFAKTTTLKREVSKMTFFIFTLERLT